MRKSDREREREREREGFPERFSILEPEPVEKQWCYGRDLGEQDLWVSVSGEWYVWFSGHIEIYRFVWGSSHLCYAGSRGSELT